MKCARVLVPKPRKTQFENITLRIGHQKLARFHFLCSGVDVTSLIRWQFLLIVRLGIRICSDSLNCLASRRRVNIIIRTDLER